MRDRAVDVLPPETPVKRDGLAELLEQGSSGLLETALPHGSEAQYFEVQLRTPYSFRCAHTPLRCNSSQCASMRTVFRSGVKPSRLLMQVSSVSMCTSSNSTILLQSMQLRWLWL